MAHTPRTPVAPRLTAAKPKPKARKPRPTRPRKPAPRGGLLSRMIRGIWRGFWRIVWWLTWRGALLGALGMAVWVGWYAAKLPAMEDLLDARSGGSVQLMDRDGNIFAWRGEQFDGSLRAGTVSPHLRNAVIATEDKRFYSHLGVSPRGIASAIRINLSEGRGALEGHGGSTITQQVAKLLCLGVEISQGQSQAEYEAECRRSSMWRKIQEVPFSLAMEFMYDKNDILSIYLNRAYLGAGAYGFEAAAQRYFGVSARDVNPSQAAMLAGLLTAPTRFAPTTNFERAQERAAIVIGLMREQGYLTEIEASIALANPATLSPAAREPVGGYFADWVMSEAPEYLTTETSEDVQILTTFDPEIQAAAETAMAEIFDARLSEDSVAQAAIVVMSADGAVRAMVGGREPNDQGGLFNRATQATRQTGSSFKPFVYAAALEAGFSPNIYVEDQPISIDLPGQPPYRPENYSREYAGLMTMTEAMSRSINTIAVRISEEVGRERVRAMAMDFGITTPLAEGPAVALGASDARLIEMTGAYAGFLNGGRYTRPYGWLDLRLAGSATVLMSAEREQGRRILSEQAAGYLVYMLGQVVELGSGRRANIPGWQVGGKTGTTQGGRDAWFIGFTADYVTGVWMGNDDNTPLVGVTGSSLPAEIWHDVMVRVHENRTPRPLPMIVPPPARPLSELDQPIEPETQNLLDILLNGPNNR